MKKRLNIKAEVTPAFTMVELIFIIIILGILASVAIPRLAATRDDAILVKGKSQISTIRSGIVMQKAKNLLEGNNAGGSFFPQTLEDSNTSMLFNNSILEYGLAIKTTDGNWNRVGEHNATLILYDFYLEGAPVRFTYTPTTGIFDCDHAVQKCKDLTE